MKNLNEEAEILSHDEKIQLNSGSGNNPGENVNIHNSTQLEVNNSNQNNKIDISNYGNNNNKKYHITINNNAVNHMNKHGINVHQHQHHQHNHDFSNPRFLYYYALGYLKYGDFFIQKFFSGVTSSLDMAIRNSSFSPAVKNLIHSKQIFLLIYIINIQYLLSSVEKITFLNFLNQNTRTLMILSIILLYLHYFFFNQKLFIEKDEELEKFIMKRNPQISKGKCEECGLLKIMRSSHCLFCDKCVKKFQLHSDWFNICIGANNELLYAITLFFINLYFFVSNLILWYYIIFRTDLLSYLAFIFTLFALAGVYITFISGRFLYKLVFECLFVNLTWYEKNNIRRLNYLFRDPYGRSVFNPFNKGIQRNLEEMLINMFDINIYNDYKNYNCQDLSELIEEDKTKKEEEEFNSFDDMASFRLMIRLVEHFDPLITSKENIYKFVDGKEIINWNRLMLFTVFDIINSPFKDMMVKQAKYLIEQRENFLKEKNKNMKKEEDEKIDESENNEDNKEDNKEKINEGNEEESKEDKEGKEHEEKNMGEK
jgi:hypothetical protein